MASLRILSSILVASSVALVACVAAPGGEETARTEQALECDANGTWAIKVTVPVKWNSSFVLQGGAGTLTNWLLTDRVQNGLAITDTAQICGIDTPDYQAASLFGAEKFGIRFPETTFGTLPTLAMTGTISSKDVGATFTAPSITALLGATLANPSTDPWPNVASLTTVDVDNDGKPGISADAKTGPGISLPPVNASRTVRANRIYTAFRQVIASTTGTVKSCSRVEGKGTIAVINGKAAIDQHVVGCRRETGVDCNASEFKLLDSAAPVYVPTGETVVTMIKLAAGTTPTCADVRALDFAPPAP